MNYPWRYGIKNGRSEKHDELTGKALCWISSKFAARGGRGGFEFRVPGFHGYVADAAAIGNLQGRYAQRFRPQKPGYTWQEFTMVFESKATRSDFLSTFGKGDRHSNRLVAVANLHWVVAAKGICTPDEVPEFWGLLVESGSGLRELKAPICQEQETENVHRFAYSVLWLKPRRTWLHHADVDERLRVPDLDRT